MRRWVAALGLAASVVLPTGSARAATKTPDHVVLLLLPGITWDDLRGARLPALRPLLGGVADLSARTAFRLANLNRGYLTLGSGNPAYVGETDLMANVAYEADDSVENGKARDAWRRRTGRASRPGVVDLEVTYLEQLQTTRVYGSEVGSLGEALRTGGIPRGVVSAADVAVDPGPSEMRRGAVLSIMDSSGAVDLGTLDGLIRDDRRAPFGVSTDPEAFERATKRALERGRVVVIDPGETARADEYVHAVAPDRVGAIRRDALNRTDAIVRRVTPLFGPGDMVITLTPSGPTPPFPEHLAPIGVSHGNDFAGRWLTSATTRRQGMVVLSDVAPTVLDAFGIDKPSSMVGTPIRAGERRADGVDELVELDIASSVRERFAAGAFWVIATILSLLAILAFAVFLGSRRRFYRPLVAVAYFGLAVFPAAHVIRAFDYWWLGVLGAHLVLYGLAALIAVAAAFLPGPRWAGGVALMLLTFILYGSDVAIGGPLQVNGVFGHSPLVAGRFYGVSNPGYAILFASAFLGVAGLAELRGQRDLPWWSAGLLLLLLPLDGLPSMGADLGGMLAGVPAVGVAIALGRGWRIRARTIVAFASAAVAVALGLSFLDYMRPPDARTHLGRFAALLVTRDTHDLGTLIHRKASASFGSLAVTRWTYFIPVSLAVLALLLIRPRGILRDVLPKHPLLRAGLWGTLVAGVLGFAVNDSGISIPSVAVAFTIPLLVLIAVDAVEPRAPLGAHRPP